MKVYPIDEQSQVWVKSDHRHGLIIQLYKKKFLLGWVKCTKCLYIEFTDELKEGSFPFYPDKGRYLYGGEYETWPINKFELDKRVNEFIEEIVSAREYTLKLKEYQQRLLQ